MYQYMVLAVFIATAVAGIVGSIATEVVIKRTDKRNGRPKMWAYRLADGAMASLGLSLVVLGVAFLAGSDEGLLGLIELGVLVALIVCGIATVIWASQGWFVQAGLDDLDTWEEYAQEVQRYEMERRSRLSAIGGNPENVLSKPDKEVMN